ncbi:MAG TPA: hemerythrin domain-containing protein [Hyphomicrobiales bacterium]|nr:hemerythrin domain-containing protein [Hyphomicrobiales bacterium]
MNFARHITRTIHDEHLETIGLVNRIEQRVMAHRPNDPPDAKDPQVGNLLRDIANSVEAEIKTHFAFEEGSLFPKLEAMGDTGIGELLTEEHQVLLPIGEELVARARAAREEGFTQESWAEFRRLAGEFAERMVAHIQKEEMGLLPILDDIIDEDQDAELSNAYAMSR